jgi:hypothetical protein
VGLSDRLRRYAITRAQLLERRVPQSLRTLPSHTSDKVDFARILSLHLGGSHLVGGHAERHELFYIPHSFPTIPTSTHPLHCRPYVWMRLTAGHVPPPFEGCDDEYS